MKLSSPWPGKGWPLTADEERQFVEQASAVTGAPKRCDEDEIVPGVSRGHVTLLVTALRQGACIDQMVQITPGLDMVALARAHHHVDGLLTQALDAWAKLRQEPSGTTLDRVGGEAAKVLPLTVSRMRAAATTGRDVSVVLSAEMAKITVLRRHFDQLADQLPGCDDDEQRTAMARQLFHPDEECLMQHPRFLPQRVGELSPLRLARLLGEQAAGDDGTGGDEEPQRVFNPAVAAARARPGRGRR